MRALERERARWHDHQLTMALLAEDECHGYLIKPELQREFRLRYGHGLAALGRLFRRPWAERARYATPELIRWWDRHPHITFEEWAWQAGFRNKFLRLARQRRWW